MLLSYLRSDLLKTKRLSIRTAHLLIPVATAAIFTAYYAFSPWGEYEKAALYVQVQGLALPVLIGLFCSLLSEQEQASGGFYSLLTAPEKARPFLSKLIILLLFGMGALLVASLLFAPASVVLLKWRSLSPGFYLAAPFVLFLGSVFLYILHLFLSFSFGRAVSVGLGLVESLVSALFLTDMGKFLWPYVPAAWPARMADVLLRACSGDASASALLRDMLPVCAAVSLAALVLFLLWASRWEGRKIY